MNVTNNICIDACAINNMSVSMMQRGNFECAARTLKGALHFVKLVRRRASQEDLQDVQHLSQQSLKDASALLSSMPPPKGFGSNVVSVEADDHQSLEEAAHGSVLKPVMIRNVSHENRYDTEAAIILYNYGLACNMLVQHQEMNPQRRDLCFSAAYQSLVLAHGIFLGRDTAEHVLMATMVLSCMLNVFCHMGDMTRSEEVSCELKRVRLYLQRSRVEHLATASIAAAA